jgi:leucyl-tRNA synthetase
VLHKTIGAVTEDLEGLRFNTAISRLMEFVNFFTAQGSRPRACIDAFVLMLGPMAPHIAEELWQALGHGESLAYEAWPAFDQRYTREDTVELPIQINGKLRAHVVASVSATNSEVEHAALAVPKVQQFTRDAVVRKVIVVPGKLVNIVISPKQAI